MNLNYLKYFYIKDPLNQRAFPKNSDHLLNIVIFSKDRACQVDSLLRSIRDHLKYTPFNVTVLYKCTNLEFENGYNITISRNILNEIDWIQEFNFSSDLKNLVKKMPVDSLVMFLVDDNIVFRQIDLTPLVAIFQHCHLFISLRTSRLYDKDKELPVFYKADDYLEWKWEVKRKRSNTWNYPFSVDGNIYHVVRIKQLFDNIRFSAPNSFESAMHDYRKCRWIRKIDKAVSTLQPVIVNNPLNRVQTEGQTWNKNIDPQHINARYLEGFIIDNSVIYNIDPTDTHQDLGLHLVPYTHIIDDLK